MLSRGVLEGLVHENPSVADYRSGLAFSLTGLGRARGRSGNHAAAVADLRRAITLREGLTTLSLEARYDLAKITLLLAGLATDPQAGIPSAEGLAEAQRALAVLQKVIAEGHRDPKMSTDPDFKPLRSRPDFRLLIMDLAMPADPYAK